VAVSQKENLGSARRGMGLKAPPRRNVLSAINNGGVNGSPAHSEVGSEAGAVAPAVEFSGRDDVERLHAEKMKGKSKNDYMVSSSSVSFCREDEFPVGFS
jgi:kinesin family protein C1